MRLELLPSGLIRLFNGQKGKGAVKRAANDDPKAYELTKFGRRPKWRGRRGMMLTVMGAGAGAAAVAAWMLA